MRKVIYTLVMMIIPLREKKRKLGKPVGGYIPDVIGFFKYRGNLFPYVGRRSGWNRISTFSLIAGHVYASGGLVKRGQSLTPSARSAEAS
jgi:hypothetical protein